MVVCDNIVTEGADEAKQIDHGACGYPSWFFKRMREQMDQQEWKNNRTISKMDRKD